MHGQQNIKKKKCPTPNFNIRGVQSNGLCDAWKNVDKI